MERRSRTVDATKDICPECLVEIDMPLDGSPPKHKCALHADFYYASGMDHTITVEGLKNPHGVSYGRPVRTRTEEIRNWIVFNQHVFKALRGHLLACDVCSADTIGLALLWRHRTTQPNETVSITLWNFVQQLKRLDKKLPPERQLKEETVDAFFRRTTEGMPRAEARAMAARRAAKALQEREEAERALMADLAEAKDSPGWARPSRTSAS